MNRRTYLNLFTFVALSGCALPAGPPASRVSTTPTAPAASPFDGLYIPTHATLLRASPQFNCQMTIANLSISTGDATLTARGVMRGRVAPDGSLDLRRNSYHFSGKITDGVFVGELEGANCTYGVTLSKS